jgi:transcriptional regulator with XRE-family HTH domain
MENTNILDRIKQVRKYKQMNQADFAKALKMAQNSYSQIETGKVNISDKNISILCLTFGVNEDWLRTSQGEMFSQSVQEEQELLLLDMFRSLSPLTKKMILNLARTAFENDQPAPMSGGTDEGVPDEQAGEKAPIPLHDHERP